MEEEEEQQSLVTMDSILSRKLNFNAPLLSTKRLCYSSFAGSSCLSNSLDTLQNTRVPFSWEQAPGKPKDLKRGGGIDDGDTPRLRLPPCLWCPLKVAAEPDVDSADLAFDQDNGCDGDDDDDNNKKTDVFSDALDDLSLSEAFDIIQQSETAAHSDSNDGLRLKLEESRGDQSPTYLINRFLPDANALAASSVLHFTNDSNKKVCDTWNHGLTGSGRNSCASSSPKGCGLGFLFSWDMKNKFCAMKSPVLPCSTNAHAHQHSSNSKHKKHCSSVHKNHVLM